MTFTPDQQLRALSWKQPYAQLMLHGKIETRTWNTKYRGWVLICASKTSYSARLQHEISGKQWIKAMDIFVADKTNINDLLGKAIAIGRLEDSRFMRIEDEEKCFVDFRPGLYCHIYEDVQPIVPFDWKGTQGWKEVSQEIKSKIQFI